MWVRKEKGKQERLAVCLNNSFYATVTITLHSSISGEPATASFIPSRSKSGSTNLPEGIVHIYREVPNATYAEAASAPPSSSQPITIAVPGKQLQSSEAEGVLIGVLAVPSWMTPSDFLSFVAPAAEGMAHLRMIR